MSQSELASQWAAMNLDAVSATSTYYGAQDVDETDGNREAGDWIQFRGNPWLRMPPITRQPAPEVEADGPLHQSSRASLRRWMDENPY